jgi:hypothetical protein
MRGRAGTARAVALRWRADPIAGSLRARAHAVMKQMQDFVRSRQDWHKNRADVVHHVLGVAILAGVFVTQSRLGNGIL